MDSFSAGVALFGLAVAAAGVGLWLRPGCDGLRGIAALLLVLLGAGSGLMAPATAAYLFVLAGALAPEGAAVWAWAGLLGAPVGLACGAVAASRFRRRSDPAARSPAGRIYLLSVVGLTLGPVTLWSLVVFLLSVLDR